MSFLHRSLSHARENKAPTHRLRLYPHLPHHIPTGHINRRLKVTVPEDYVDVFERGKPWRVDLFVSAVVHDRMLSALLKLQAPLSAEAAASGSAVAVAGDAPALTAGYTALQLALLALPAAGLQSAAASGAAAAALRPTWLQGSASGLRLIPRIAREETAALNASQQAAVAAALGRTLTLWQGPPGTGKTCTLVAFIRAAVRAVRATGRMGGPAVLATAPSNVAVDNILQGLLGDDDGGEIKVVRLGTPAKARLGRLSQQARKRGRVRVKCVLGVPRRFCC